VGEGEHGSWLNFLYKVKVAGRPLLPEWIPPFTLWAWLIAVALCVVGIVGTRKRQRIPTGLQNALEAIVDGMNRFFEDLTGPRAAQFSPFLGALFLYILTMNLCGLVPGFLSPTANLNTTLGLALLVFFTVQYYGVKLNGVWGYLKHFVGGPLPWWLGWFYPMMILVHLVGELARPLSLSFRLFGNIMGEDTVIMMLVALSPLLFKFRLGQVVLGLPIPVAVPMMAFAIFTGVIQALVFTALSGIYLSLAAEPVGAEAH
jgi:F-type H+-transporting ATPase subunit a